MAHYDNLLAIVEPTTGGDATLDLALEAVEHGGTARVVMLVTDRVRRDIQQFADSENLDLGVAEALALGRLEESCSRRVGGSSAIATHFGGVESVLRDLVTPDTTMVALPERLAARRRVRRLASHARIPVVITPDSAA